MDISLSRDRKRLKWVVCAVMAFLLVVLGSRFITTNRPMQPLLVGSNAWPGYAPLYLADELDFLDEPIKLVQMTSASEVIHAFRSGSLHVAALTLDEALTIAEDQIDIEIIAILDYSMGADALLAKPQIDQIGALKGKKIAVEHTAVGAILLDAALSFGKLSAQDIEIEMCTVDQHLECYNRVDAVVTFEPQKTRLQQLGARVLFDSASIPGRIVDVLVVANLNQDQQRLVRRLLAGYFKARDYMLDHPSDANQRLSGLLDLTPDQLQSAYEELELVTLERNRVLLNRDSNQFILPEIGALIDLMVDKSLLRARVKVDDLVNDRYLP